MLELLLENGFVGIDWVSKKKLVRGKHKYVFWGADFFERKILIIFIKSIWYSVWGVQNYCFCRSFVTEGWIKCRVFFYYTSKISFIVLWLASDDEEIVTKEKWFYNVDKLRLLISYYSPTYCQANNNKTGSSGNSAQHGFRKDSFLCYAIRIVQ